MPPSLPPSLLDTMVAYHHDYVWARLPFVVPMAITAARRRGDPTARELARLMVELRPLLIDHLEREERMDLAPATTTLHAEHVAVTSLLDHIREIAGGDYRAPSTDPTVNALYLELARLDEHLDAQIALEEHLMAWRQGHVI